MLLESLGAYLPMDRLRAIADRGALPERASGAALFADISGFTPLTNALARELGAQRGAEELTQALNAVYTALIAEVANYGGSVISFSGDAITCWFDEAQNTEHRAQSSESSSSGSVLFRSALSAVACALAMQRVMEQFAAMPTPAGSTVSLRLKVAVAGGTVRRFQVGDPQYMQLDTLVGDTLDRLATAEHAAHRGEVIVDLHQSEALAEHLVVADRRRDDQGEPVLAVVNGLRTTVEMCPWPPFAWPRLDEEQLRPWLLAPVYARLMAGQGQFLAELRPGVALFLRFAGIDYEHDPAAGTKLDAFIRWVQRLLARYDGNVLQLTIGDKGSYLCCGWGAPFAHEDDGARALLAALQLQNPPAELAFIGAVQIGISRGRLRTGAYGSATRLTYGILGDEVNLAARLMQAAPPGAIYVSAAAYEADAARFSWEELPPLTVKGRSDAITVYRLIAARERQALHFQTALYGLPLVGRSEELTIIRRKITEAIGGQGQIIAIVAEAGLGKSRLVVESVRIALDRGMTLFAGECQSYGTNDSYHVWENIWQSFFGLDRSLSPELQIEMLRADLAAIDPTLLPRLPLLSVVLNLPIADNDLTASLDARLRKVSLEALLVDCIRARCRARPTVLVIEDGQWLDPLSHDLLEAIGRAIADMPVLILFAYRPPELEHLRAPRVTGLLHTTVIELHDLSAVEAAELVALKQIHLDMPAELPPDVVDRIVARTQGNPFYIEELISYLFTLGLAPQSVAELDRLDLPTSLASLILGRIDQLSESQKTTLKVASVIGRLFRAGWLWGFYPGLGEPARIRADLDVLNRLDLTPLDQPEPELTYLFKHILTHGVAYESLPFATRSWLHGELARFIEQQYGGILEQFIDLLAYHYDISGIEEKRREYLYKAGMAAQAAYANAAAIDYYRRLLPLLDAEEKVPVLLQLGQVLELTGQWSEVAALYRQALTLSEGQHNAQLRAQARNALGNLYSRRGEYNEASTALEEAQHDFVLAGDKAGVGQTLHYRGALEMRRGDLDAARALWEISLEMRRELGDESNVATLLSNLGIVAHYQGDYDGAITMYQRSLFISRRIGARLVTARALNNYGLVAREQNDFVTARELFDESLNLRREIGDRWGIANGLNNLGQIARELGDLATAETMFEESMAINREIGDKGALVYLLEDFGFLAARQQEPERALILLAAAAAQREATGASRSSAEQQRFEQIRAELEAALGPNADPAWQRGHTMSLDEAIAYASPINSLKSP